MKVTVLRSKENLVWVSMNEIIPWIIRLWEKWGTDRGHSVTVLDIDGKDPSSLFPELFKSDLVVLTSFTTSMARLIYLAKGRLGMPLRCVFYLHNQATIGCWPMYEWKMGEVLDTNDVFIGSCTRDKESMDICFENATTLIHPFSLDDYALEVVPPPSPPLAHFVFIGRISPQKNLHTAIWAFHLLKIDHPELKWKFELFGGEDNYGSPLMGIGYNTYREFLEGLIDNLDLKEEIVFRGFQDRELINREMEGYQRIFLAPSLHSDENFGMAAFRSLSQGHKVILSDWGGHGDYREHFQDNLFLLPVRESIRGPVIDASDLVRTLKEAADASVSHTQNSRYYDPSSLFKVLDDLMETPPHRGQSLRRTPLGERIQKKRAEFYQRELQENENSEEKIRGCRIFEDYQDPDGLAMFRAYGMNTPLKRKTGPVIRAPWVFPSPDHLIVHDPMKGVTPLPYSTKLKEDLWLLENGYATPIED